MKPTKFFQYTYFNCLAFHNDLIDLEEKKRSYLDAILQAFNEETIKTEKLYNKNKLLSLKLDYKKRAICTVINGQEHDTDKNILVVLELLEDHDYDRSKYISGAPINYDDLNKHIKIVAAVENEMHPKPDQKQKKLPKRFHAAVNNQIIILGREQSAILDNTPNEPSVFKVIGAAGSGKTTIATLLIEKQIESLFENHNRKILYITKSANLVSAVKKNFEAVTEKQKETLQLVDFKSYQTLCGKLIFQKLFKADSYKNYIESKSKKIDRTNNIGLENPSYETFLAILEQAYKADEKAGEVHPYLSEYLEDKLYNQEKFIAWLKGQKRFKDYIINHEAYIGQQIYEDIRKLKSKSAADRKLGRKESYGHSISNNVFTEYEKYLKNQAVCDPAIESHIDEGGRLLEPYNYIIVDEAQDFGKVELQRIQSLLDPAGSIYFFMDANQSLVDDFNMTSDYIDELFNANQASTIRAYQTYALSNGYRTPHLVTQLANNILEVKRKIIGGSFDRKAQWGIGSNHTTGSPGYIELIQDADNKTDPDTKLNNLQQEVEKSIEIAIVVPDNDTTARAKKLFPGGVVYTPKEIKGLEFTKIVLVDFISGKYPFNQLTTKLLSSIETNRAQSKLHAPKDLDQAKKNGSHAHLLSNLFVAVTRTAHSIYFIEQSNKQTRPVIDAFYKTIQLKELTNSDNEIKLANSSTEQIIEFIKKNQSNLSSEILTTYCQKAYTRIKESIDNGKADTSFRASNYTNTLGYLSDLKDVMDTIQTADAEIIKEAFLQWKEIDALCALRPSQDMRANRQLASGKHDTALPKQQGNATDKILTLEDLKGCNIHAISPQQLTQVLPNGKNVLLSLILVRSKEIEEMESNHFEDFIDKITSKALHSYDGNGNPMLYYLAKLDSVSIEKIFFSIIRNKNFIRSINKEILNRIGSDGWPLLFSLLIKAKKDKVCYGLLNNHIDGIGIANDRVIKWIQKTCHYLNESDILKIKNGITALHLALEENNPDLIGLLLKKEGINVNHANNQGITILHIATQKDYTKIVKLLLEKEGININCAINQGINALHIAVNQKNSDIIKLLLNKEGLQINAADMQGRTALHMAVEQDHQEIVRLLLEAAYIDINAADSKGITPLHLAAQNGHKEIVHCLVNHNKININAADSEGITPLFIATQNGHKKIVLYLRKQIAKIHADDRVNKLAHQVVSLDTNEALGSTISTTHSHQNKDIITSSFVDTVLHKD